MAKDDRWKRLFDSTGVTKEEQETKETMEFIYDFVEKRGGTENVAREIEMESKGANTGVFHKRNFGLKFGFC